MDAFKVFDSEALLERVDNDVAFLKELLETFWCEYPKQIAPLREAVRNGALESVARGAHGLKSALGNIGAMKAHAIAAELELSGKTLKNSGQAELLARLEAAIASFKIESDRFVSKSD